MNYIAQLNAFKVSRLHKPLSTNCIALYYILLEYNNALAWQEWFTATNKVLEVNTGLSRNALHIARNELMQKGYIQYKKGTGNQCGSYLIVRFDTQTNTQSDTQTNTQSDTQSDTQTQHKVGPLNKQKQKQKLKEKNTLTSIPKEKPPKVNFVKPTIAEIEAHCQERGSNVNATSFFNFYESKGWLIGKNHMKNWKAAVITWEQKNKKDKQQTENPYLRGDLFDNTGSAADIGNDFNCLPEFQKGKGQRDY